MIEEKLEIVLITYNRYKDLDNTLKQFLDGPFSSCKTTILDNCSDDKTPQVCDKYQKLFPDLRVVRHEKNIGGNANILRAVETSKSMYTWVICDDDSYDFSESRDVIDAIDSEKYDLISPGSLGEDGWERGLSTTVQELVEKGSPYFLARSFIPGLIFKTELFDSICIMEGFANIPNFFPFFPFIYKSFENNFSIYLSKSKIINRGTHNMVSFSSVNYIKGWISSCLIIKEKKLRKKTAHTLSWGGRSLYSKIFLSIIWEKLTKEEHGSRNILFLLATTMAAFGFSFDELIILLMFLIAIVPAILLRSLLKSYVYLKYDRGKNMPTEWSVLFTKKKKIDPLRKF
jgi:glycosyltransferase involved in cell wall biosynthesis